jgi:HAE1 family hydrophobic/amphiphilic exporter-1
MLKRFIERPVLSTVVSIILLILGGLSIFTLPISLFPDIAPPSVVVQATYPGANAEVVARSVATPLEEAINGVEGMTYMTSNSSNDGSMLLTVYFKQGTNPDIAAVNVQNRVSKATSQIPQEVVQAGISTQKQQNSIIMFVGLYSTDTSYDETFLQNYAKINLIPRIQRIPGVADAQPFGTKDYSMRIWLKPDRLVANNLSPIEVTNAIRDQSLEAAPGRLGQSSKEVYEYVLRYKGKLNKNVDYENIIVKSNSDGSVVRLKDVARVEFGSYTYSSNSTLNGYPTTGIAIQQLAGSNANDILTQAEELIKKFDTQLPKGLHTTIMFNSKEFLDASIEQVKHTLVEAFILVFIVVFIFLQDFRSTLIPAIAVPVAIIGTFFFLQVFGFTINLLTLFALVLAIGIVVDDAIVVVEAVHAKMEHTGLPVKQATLKAMSEISGAIVSITLVMAAVFIPVGFMKGPTGVFYRQFGYTLAIAIFISAVNALTLSPALCAIFLKDIHTADEQGKKKGFLTRFYAAFNAGFKTMTDRYVGSLRFLFRHKWITIAALVVLAGSAYLIMQRTPSGFIPTEDQGFILYAVNTPPGSSLDKTHKAVAEIDSIIKASPVTDRRYNVEGLNFITNANASPYGAGFVRMKPVDERGPVKDINAISGLLTMEVAQKVKDAHAFFFTFPTIQGFGNVAGFEFALQDQTNGSMDRLSAMSNQFIGALMQRPEIAYAFTTFASGNPQYMMDVNDDKAKQMGVSISDLMQTMQIYYGSSFVDDFNRFGKYYRVMAQADIPYRNNEQSLTGIYVKNNQGQMIPVNQLITLRRVYGPETVSHNNLYNSATINGVPKPGYSTGDAIRAIDETAAKILPHGWGYEYTGITREEKAAGSQIIFIFVLSLVFIYFLLAAQYESYILPFAIVLSIPAGVFGVFLFLQIFGIDNNIYVQVSLVMLVGLLAKNAILITEYAVQRRHNGMGLWESAMEAARLRLRPILMTSFAFIVGLTPLMRAKGAAALGNRSIGTGAVGGMLTGVILGVFIVPVLFIIFQYLQEKWIGRPKVETAHGGGGPLAGPQPAFDASIDRN